MTNKTRELGTAILGGLIACGVLTIVLDFAQIGVSTIIGALAGGLVAAYLLYGKISQAALAGALSGVLAVPFIFGLSYLLLIFEVVPIPSGPTPEMSVIQASIVALAVMNFGLGAIGGAVLGAIHHPPREVPPPPPPPSTAGVQMRYCAQCGAQLPPGALICPQCNARQPG